MGQRSTPTSFLNRACLKDLFSSQLYSIAEVKSFDGADGEDEDHEQQSDWICFSQSGGFSVPQQHTSGDPGHESCHGNSGGPNGGGRKHTQIGDTSLESSDEEERFETTLWQELQTLFPKMLHVPEVKE